MQMMKTARKYSSAALLFHQKNLNNKLSNLRAGDKIDIYYESDLSYLIDIVFCE